MTEDTSSLPAALGPVLSKAQRSAVVNIVRRASKAEVLPRFRALSSADITTKSRADDLVTVADTATEAMITRALQIAFPSALIVGEEASTKDASLLGKIADAPMAFIIDPIDGTWNFAHGLGVFGIIVAVTRFGRPAFGMIYDPLQDDWAIADDQGPAEMQRPYGAPTVLKSSLGKSTDAMNGHVPLSLFPADKKAQVAAALTSFAHTEALRSSAHEYRQLAQGHSDFIITALLHPWDHAAGALICQQAGCHVEMLAGGDYSAAVQEGHLLVASDKSSWNKVKKVFGFLLD